MARLSETLRKSCPDPVILPDRPASGQEAAHAHAIDRAHLVNCGAAIDGIAGIDQFQADQLEATGKLP